MSSIICIKMKIPSDFLLEIRQDLSVCTPETVSQQLISKLVPYLY